jgi:hypothetical protein
VKANQRYPAGEGSFVAPIALCSLEFPDKKRQSPSKMCHFVLHKKPEETAISKLTQK